MDNRALAFGWFDIMILGLGLFALIYALLNQPVSMMLEMGSSHATTDEAVTGINHTQDAWAYAPAGAMLLAAFALITRAVVEGRLP